MTSRFTVYGDDSAAALATDAGYPAVLRRPSALAEQLEEIPSLAGSTEVSILDFVHGATLADVGVALQVVAAWRRHSRLAVLIDGAGRQALRADYRQLDIDLVVAPYAGEAEVALEHYQVLAGAQYAILEPSFANLPARVVRRTANRVLIACGGADPLGLTPTVLVAVESVPMPLKVDVVVGPLFGEAPYERIAELSRDSRHDVSLLEGLTSLAEAMSAADVAICSSGLLKYELAATGTPALLIALDHAHLDADGPFMASGTAEHLGTADHLNGQVLANCLARLLEDAGARQRMADHGQRLVDGCGAKRVVATLGKYASM